VVTPRPAVRGAPALAIHPGALGDILLAVPALRALRAQAGQVVLAAQPRIGALLQTLGVIDRHVAFDSLGLDALFVNDASRAPRLPAASRVVCWFGARDATFARRLTALAPGAVVAPPAPAGGTVWEHLLGTVDAGGSGCEAIEPTEALRSLGLETMLSARADGPSPWLVVHPGAGSAAKCWPAEAFARVVTRLAAGARMNVLVHQGPADGGAVAALRRHLGAGVVWLVEPGLPALAGVLAHARAYLGNDSGVSHLAAALGVPGLVLFDPRNLPWRPWWPGIGVRPVTLTETREADVAGVLEDMAPCLR
jgi:glycosyl transferase family 9 (putative heptosyltransferase)